MTAVLVALLALGCSSNPDVDVDVDVDVSDPDMDVDLRDPDMDITSECPEPGRLFPWDGVSYCIAPRSAGDECPDDFPNPNFSGELLICSKGLLDTEAESEIYARMKYAFEPGPCPGGTEVVVEDVAYCAWGREDISGFRCPSDGTEATMHEGIAICGPANPPAAAIVQELAARCAAASSGFDACAEQEGCEFVGAENRMRMVDGECQNETAGLCVLFPGGGGNNGIITCQWRSAADAEEAFVWGAIATAYGWEGGYEPETVPDVCRCNGEFGLD